MAPITYGTSYDNWGAYVDTDGVLWNTSGYASRPPAQPVRITDKALCDALTKQRKREAVAARTRTALRAVARQQALQARHEIEARRPFLRPVGKRQTERARRRQFA